MKKTGETWKRGALTRQPCLGLRGQHQPLGQHTLMDGVRGGLWQGLA